MCLCMKYLVKQIDYFRISWIRLCSNIDFVEMHAY